MEHRIYRAGIRIPVGTPQVLR